MSREVKFRGFRDRTEQWVYGYLVKREEPYLHDILEPIGNTLSVTYAVRRGSEGQFTGLHDKNREEIYEGDIDRCGYIVTYVDGSDSSNLGMNVGFYAQRDGFESWAQMEVGEVYEIIGNIYENPELLEVDAE